MRGLGFAAVLTLHLMLAGGGWAGQAAVPFPGLHTLSVPPLHGQPISGITVKVHYDPNLAKLELRRSNPVANEEALGREVRLLTTTLDRHSARRVVVYFSPGPSDDPSFTVVREEDGERLGQLPGLELFLPGNGFLYTSGHSNNTFDQRRKYRVGDGRIEEVRQPFSYVGLQSRAKRDLIITCDQEGEEEVAVLPRGSEVTVLLNDGDAYLLKTTFGLVGWLRLSALGWQDDDLEGLFRRGD